MSISEEEVKRIAKLAKFKVEDEDVVHFTEEFGNILNMIEELQEYYRCSVYVLGSRF